jgi:PAS domain S-box-containing protein
MYGYTREELLSMTNADLSAEPDETTRVTVQTPIVADQVVTIPLRFHRRKDGSVIPVEITGRFFIREKRPVHIAAIRDITERRRAEEALRESERKYRFLTERMNDIIWTMDTSLKTTYVSPSITTALGFTPEERMAQKVEEQVTPESFHRIIDLLTVELEAERQGTADPNRTFSIEVEYYRKDGSTVWMENLVGALRDESGAFAGLHGVSRDITERRRAEESIRESEARFRAIFNNASIGIDLVDKNGRFLQANDALVNMLGYTKEEFMKFTNVDITHPEDIELSRINLERLAGERSTPTGWRSGLCIKTVRWSGRILPLLPSPIRGEAWTVLSGSYRTSPSASAPKRRCG